MSKIKTILDTTKNFIVKNSSSILTGLGIAGFGTTVVMGCKATPKAMNELEELKKDNEEIANKDKVIWLAKSYWPTATVGALSISCFIFANHVNLKRNAALIAAYRLSEGKLKDYQENVLKTIGTKKEKEIRDKSAKSKILNNPPDSNTIIYTGDGDILCYDSISGRYFKSSIEKLRKTENDLNRRLMNEINVSLNDYYEEIGLDPVNIGDMLGWGLFTTDDMIELELSSQLTKDDKPCLVIDYNISPKYFNPDELA